MSGGEDAGAGPRPANDAGAGRPPANDAGERADYHVRMQEQRRARESAKAQVLLEEFVRTALERGLATTDLTARTWKGSSRYRTGVRGWYLRLDRSVAVDPDGRYYSLLVPPRSLARFRGVEVAPTDPPLQVGEGARDGESVTLAELLRLRLEAGDDFVD
ncbi:hypothetical protein ACFUC1_10975 [Pedococcus sp. NPDC057267]|uniref:hypothetical protein n=1 Tax=Pedococcus sp. NPDC057267 TaxID=3346077 RepID=UPI00362919E6